MGCPCGTGREFSVCCQPIIEGKVLPETAEVLMRSRYTAYVIGQINYIKSTLASEFRRHFDVKTATEWAKESQWLGLIIHNVKNGNSTDKTGTVEFTAKYTTHGKTLEHHEISQFRKESDGRWYFVDGDAHTHEDGQGPSSEPVVRDEPKVGRNDLCPCGSGKKFKKCCGIAA